MEYFWYSPWGETLQADNSWRGKFSSPFKFTGHIEDEETGLTYAGARYYPARESQWLSVDPLAEKYPTLTPYNYVANNPVVYFDPDGRWIPGFDDDGNVTLTMEKGDDFESFKAFFKNSTENNNEDILRCAYDSRSEDGVVNLSVEVGGVFAEMKTAFNNARAAGYPTTERLLSGAIEGPPNYNCWGSCLALNENKKLEGSGPGTGVGISTGEEFDARLNSDYSATTVENAIVGRTILRYADRSTNSSDNGHGAIFMGTDRSGNQYVFSKNGWHASPGIFKKSFVNKIYRNNVVRGVNPGNSGYYNRKP
ncbi:MAG: RHS repeat-associated core domain-containing protein [Cryomorphaceae bacterium]|nr:RHS repeat-associated core domain-containing protein [Cryomorphaceae bacterium]